MNAKLAGRHTKTTYNSRSIGVRIPQTLRLDTSNELQRVNNFPRDISSYNGILPEQHADGLLAKILNSRKSRAKRQPSVQAAADSRKFRCLVNIINCY